MDCTQVLENDDLDNSLAYKYKVKVAELKVNDNLYPIFSGSNRIGRDPEFCSVVFNNMTLSKEHAVIEVEDRFSHLIYDLGSKNKTRVGKTVLKPHIRYQLLDKSQILLGDMLAEYYVIPEGHVGKPFAVIQESDDEVIPDTPVQSKESSSSREESPTIFQMETQCQLGYDEPCVKIVQEPGELEGNLTERSHPQDENKLSSTAVASDKSMTVSTTGSFGENFGEDHDEKSATKVNDFSDGDETDPEDVFFALTQKRDESICESSDKKKSNDVKDMTENEQLEARDPEVNCKNQRELYTDEEAVLLPSSKNEEQEKVEDIFSAATQVVLPEAEKVEGQGEGNVKSYKEEKSTEYEAKQKDTVGLDSDEGNGQGSTISIAVVREPSAEKKSVNLFKVPLAADVQKQSAQMALPPGEGEEAETNPESDDDSFFNAATQIIQQGNYASQVFKTPVAAKYEQEMDRSPERNGICDNTRMILESVYSDLSGHNGDGVFDVQVDNSKDKEETLSRAKKELKEKVPSTIDGQPSTEKEVLENSDPSTEDESSFVNAPTQEVQTVTPCTDSKDVSPGSADLGKPTGSNSDGINSSKDGKGKEVAVVMKADVSIFSGPTKVVNLGGENTVVSPDEVNVEPKGKKQQLAGTSKERGNENDSVFEESTIIHPENNCLDSLNTSKTQKQIEEQAAIQKLSTVVPNSEMKKKGSIYDVETRLGSNSSTTFKTSTPVKKKKSVAFEGISSDGKQITTPEDLPKEGATGIDTNKVDESFFDAPTQVMEHRMKGNLSSEGPSGDPKDNIPTEEIRKLMSEPKTTCSEPCGSSETKLLNCWHNQPLDDSDDSIFSAPTQLISEPKSLHDSISQIAEPNEDFNSPSAGTKVVPEPDSRSVEYNKEKLISEQDSSDVSEVANRNESALNDSFFEAATQLYTSAALDEEINSPNDDKANKSLSRSSSYSSIHEAPTQCMDDLVAELNSENVKGNGSVEILEKSGLLSEVQKSEMDAAKNTREELLQNQTVAASSSNANDSVDLILPSSQELRQVGQECYGYMSDDERPSTSIDTVSPVVQKRVRSIARGILTIEGLDSKKTTIPSSFKSSGSISVKSSGVPDDQRQPDVESKKQLKFPKETNNQKKTTGKRKPMAAKEGDKGKKITDYLESSSAREKRVEQGSKSKESKGSNESEMGRPSRQRRPTWKARESSQDLLPTAAQKSKKGENKEQSKASPGSSKQMKKDTVSPNDLHTTTDDEIRKEKSKLSTKKGTESSVNSESKLEDSERHSRKTENPYLTPSKQRNTLVNSPSPPLQSEKKRINAKSSVKLKRSIRGANKSGTAKHILPSSVEINPVSNSPSAEREWISIDPNSPKKLVRSCLPSSSSDQDDRKGSNIPVPSVSAKANKDMTCSRRKPSTIPVKPRDQEQNINPLHGGLQNKKVDTNKRSRPKQSAIVDHSSPTNLVSKPEHSKMQQDDSVSIASERQENTDLPSFSDPDKKEGIGRRGRQKRTTTASCASSSDIGAKPVKGISTPSDEQTESNIQPHDDKNKMVQVCRRGRSKQSATNSISSSEVETKLEGTRDSSSDKPRENSLSPRDQLGVQKRGREMESKPSAHSKRTRDVDVCDTPVKQRKTSVVLSHSDQDQSAVVGKGGRAKRSANKAFASSKDSISTACVTQEQKGEELDICDTPRKQRKMYVSSLGSSEIEILETNKRGRSKRSTAASASLASKQKLTSTTLVTPDKNTQTGPATPPPSTKQRKTNLQSKDKTTSKTNDVAEQDQCKSRKKGLNVLMSDEDQSECGSPLFGSLGRRRRPQSQASSTESDGHSSQSEGTPKRSSRIKHHVGHRIMFTGVGCTHADEAAIKKLGGKVVQEPEVCTVLITDKIRRTLKFLSIMGQGKPIVTPDWIKQSRVSGHFLDPWNFIVRDKETEEKYSFQLQRSLKQASVKKLLDGYCIFATLSVKPPPTEMKGIVENCGGQFLTKEPGPGKWPEKSLIISAVDDKKLCSKFKKLSVPIVSAEILLTGILQQKLNVNDYILKL